MEATQRSEIGEGGSVSRKHLLRDRSVFSSLLTAIFTLGASAGTTVDSYPDLRLLQSDERGITLEIVPQAVKDRRVTIGNRTYVEVAFLRAQSLDLDHLGEPDTKFRTVLVGLPGWTGHRVEILDTQFEEMSGAVLVPVQSNRGSSESEPVLMVDDWTRRVGPSPEFYSRSQFIPASIAHFVSIDLTRNTLVGQLRIYPVQYHPALNVIRKYSRIVLRIDFGPPEVPLYEAVGRQRRGEVGNPLVESVLINYAAAKRWDFSPSSVTQPVSNSLLATGDWYRIEVRESGMYRLDANFLVDAGIDVSQLDPTTIKVYGNGGLELPTALDAPRPTDLIQNAIYVAGENDGRFDPSDYILFYGRGTREWRYDPAARTFRHYLNHYSESNYYWLTYDGDLGKRMAEEPSLAAPNPYRAPRFTEKIHVEEERSNLIDSGLEWFGLSFNPSDQFVFTSKLEGLVREEPIDYRLTLLARSDVNTTFRIEETGGRVLRTLLIGPVIITGNSGLIFNYANRGTVDIRSTGELSEDRSNLKFVYQASKSTAIGWLDWFDILYQRRFVAVNDLLRFTSPDTTAVIEYELNGFSNSNIKVFNVTHFADVGVVSSAFVSGSTFRFQSAQTSGTVSEYIAVGQGGYKQPASIQRVSNSDVRGMSDGVEFVIITHRDFLTAANRLKQYREQPGDDFHSTVVVDVQHIFNEFGGGLPDPTAIRDFLKYAYENWKTKPVYVLFFGGGDYDYRNLTGQSKIFIPPFNTLESLFQIRSFASDDYFVNVAGQGEEQRIGTVDLIAGRLPVRSSKEADIVVQKIIDYEHNQALDIWRNTITFVADDAITTSTANESMHTNQTETLVNVHTPNSIERKKIYLAEYPTVISSTGRRKPDVNKAIVAQLNRGSLIINYIGHGNPRIWAHENVFVKETTIPQLQNKDRLFFVVAATCDFSRFDEPAKQSSAELLVATEAGGAIGCLSATRGVFSSSNAQFNYAFFDRLFMRDVQGRTQRLGRALFNLKQLFTSQNDQKYFLLGDPIMRLVVPPNVATIDSINGRTLETPVQLKALSRITVDGTVRKSDGTEWTDFNGRALMVVLDSERSRSIPDGQVVLNFTVPGGTIYRGENSITNGRFSASFVVPKDISYENRNGRITVYFWNDGADGSGFTQNIIVGGTDSSAAADIDGPRIDIFLDKRSFRSGDMVAENAVLIVDLFDENGINISGTAIGHRLEAWIDNSAQSVDLTEFYKGKIDSFQEGVVEYQLSDLAPGHHSIRVRAWDVYNNSNTREVFFSVASSGQLEVANVYNFPNPFSGSTTFTFQHNQLLPLDVEIKIYTISGRLIEALQTRGITDRFVRIPWNGRDRDGDELANGVYFYKVIVKTQEGELRDESLGKLTVLR